MNDQNFKNLRLKISRFAKDNVLLHEILDLELS